MNSRPASTRILSVLLIGFGTLGVLIALLWFSAVQRAEQMSRDATTANQTNNNLESILSSIRGDIYRSGIVLRDYVDDEFTPSWKYREDALKIESEMQGYLNQLDSLMVQDRELLARLRQQIKLFWDLREPVFQWTPKQKKALSRTFLERDATPQRDAVLSIMSEIARLRAAAYEQEELDRTRLQETYRAFLNTMFSIALLLAGVVAGISIFSIHRLHRRSEHHRQRSNQAEEGLRRLSQQLVQTQEEERKAISRELHDEIGQVRIQLHRGRYVGLHRKIPRL